MRYLFFLVLFFCLLYVDRTELAVAQTTSTNKDENALLWRITKLGSKDTSYLFGTLHLLEKSYVDTLPHVMEEFQKSDVIIGEMVLDSSIKEELQNLLDTGESLMGSLDSNDYNLVSSELIRIAGLPLSLFDSYEPIALYALLLEGLYAKNHPENIHTHIPMDLYFQHKAKSSGKRVMGLESLHDQASVVFDSIPTQQQAMMLLDFVRHEDREMNQLDTLVLHYQRGEIDSLINADDIDGMTTSEMEALLYKRNDRWAEELAGLLSRTKAFIAVGAGHLAGQRGLIAGLRRKGYRVEPIVIK